MRISRLASLAPPAVEPAQSICELGAMSVAEACIFAGLGRSTLYTLMDEGELAYTTVGRRRLIPRRALVELLERGLAGGTR